MHKGYLKWLLLFCCLSLVPAASLNMLLITHSSNVQQRSMTASDWQHRTHGITYTPTSGDTWLFKSMRLNDRLPEIDTVVFGSSTAMTIDSGMLPADWHLYNFTQSGHPLVASLGEAEYLAEHAPAIKHYLIMLDWALGFPYEAALPAASDLSPAAITAAAKTPTVPIDTLALLRDTLSYPRMEQLAKIIKDISKSSRPVHTFGEYFLQQGSDDYALLDGIPCKDFDIYERGNCNGFRHDGSATFSGYTRVNNAKQLLMAETASNSKYLHNLRLTNGKPNQALLARLAKLHTKLIKQGSDLLLIMPPLMPGFEQIFMHHPLYSTYLQTTKNSFAEWAHQEQIILLDSGQSERYGCTSDEFLDIHHATAHCYQKVFSAFWQNAEGKMLLATTHTH